MNTLDPTLRHLYIELTRLDLMIHRRVAQMEQAFRPAEPPESPARALHMTVDDVHRLLQQPFGEMFAGAEPVSNEAELQYRDAFAEIEQQIAAAAARDGSEAGHAPVPGEPEGSRLVQLALACGLSRYELDAFLICLAPALDLRYERLYGFLHDDLTRRRATVNLILDLLSPPGPERLLDLVHFSDRAPLLSSSLLEVAAEPGIVQPSLLNQALAVEPSLVFWLLGDYRPGASVAAHIQYEPTPVAHPALLTDVQARALSELRDPAAFVSFTGKDGGGQRNAFACLAETLGAPLLLLDLKSASRSGADLEATLKVFLRDASLTNALAAIAGWEVCLEDGSPPVPLFAMVCAHAGPVAVGCETTWRPRSVDRERRLTWIDFPPPDYVQRKQFLSALLDGLPADGPLDIAGLTGRFMLTTRQLADLVATALDWAAQERRTLRDEDLYRAAREHSSPRLSTLAHKLVPRYDWADLILPEDQVARLHELVQMVQGRARVLDEWGLGRKLAASHGVTALFAGSPGTGKTMAAEVIARVLGLDLYKIDLSGLISKYIGETEKNLERIFTEAENSNAILFFDEADAVFGKRSEVKDAHDRYANIETSYLLQRMEAYDGVTILATNLRANLDEAFTRRIHAIVDFPFPDAEQRQRIWTALFPAGAPSAPDIDLPVLARRFKMAGGSIRNVLVTAAYLASADDSPMTQAHLLHATRRELQKLGRLTDERDFVA